jgi:hypothetical protein
VIFKLWNPRQIATDQLAFDVTRANIPRVATGDPNWIADCLQALGVATSARAWDIQAARCHFYSDYPDEPDWRDRWPETWIVRVSLGSETHLDLGAAALRPTWLDSYDRTWIHEESSPAHNLNALLLLFSRCSPGEAPRVRDRLLSSLPPELGVPATWLDQPVPNWVRLRMLISGTLFSERVELLEQLLLLCRRQELLVNHCSLE